MSRIEILLVLGPNGLIRRLTSVGHASLTNGFRPACVLVSAALRSFGRLLGEKSGVPVQVKIDGPGHFELKLNSVPQELGLWYGGVCDLLKKNLEDAQTDFPGQIHIELRNIELEQEL